MLDFNKTFELIKKIGYFENVKVLKKTDKELTIHATADSGVFVSIVEINITYYGTVSFKLSLGKFANINDKYRKIKEDFVIAKRKYEGERNGLFMFSSISYNNETHVALLFNDITITRDNTTPEKVKAMLLKACDYLFNSSLSGYITAMGIALNEKK